MAVTDEDIQKKQDKLAKLREQIADAHATREERESEASNEIIAAQLDAEEARLTAELVAAKESAKKANIRAGAADLLSQVKENEAVAAAQAANAETLADKSSQPGKE